MSETTRFLIDHGLPIVFGAVFLDQIGVPIPAAPWLMAAGALAAAGKFDWPIGVAASVLACLIADFIWFYLGRHHGTRVLGFLCRISLEPDTCVRRTLNLFTRYGWRGIVVAKFVPGMSTVTPPMAGMSQINAGQFLLFDGLGSVLYSVSFIMLGYFFSGQIAQIGAALGHIGGDTLSVIVILLVLYVAYKYWQRQSVLRELRMAKISVDELGRMLDAGESPFILDLRSNAELEEDPAIIRGAIHVSLEELEKRHPEFPRDREIVVYCDCPNEVTSARTALVLRRKGFKRVRPLLGGIDAWRKAKHPMAVWTKQTTTTTTTVLVSEGLVPAEAEVANKKAKRPSGKLR